MKISILSDIHLEFETPIELIVNNLEEADILILAGDCTTYNRLDLLQEFLARIIHKFTDIIYIPGNHEYYYCNEFSNADDIIKKAIDDVSHNCMFMQSRAIDINNINFVCATLWTDFDNYNQSVMNDAILNMSDYRVIADGDRLITPEDIYIINQQHKRFIETKHRDDMKNVLITHHAPSSEISKFSKFPINNLTPMFYNNNIYIEPYDLCVYGHTHENVDFISKEGVRIVSNQLGYPNEKKIKNLNKIVHI